jgi:hypothetical protein
VSYKKTCCDDNGIQLIPKTISQQLLLGINSEEGDVNVIIFSLE